MALVKGTLIVLVFTVCLSSAQGPPPSSVTRQSLDDAWWTGPLAAPSAATLPHGHFLIEPYLYDVVVQGYFDRNGERRSAPHAHGFGSLTYILYGLTDRFTVGLIPTAGYNTAQGAPSSSGPGMGDLGLKAQYRLVNWHEGKWVPTLSLAFQETLPSGKYDQLGNRTSDGFGSGSYTSTLALYSQKYIWMPTARILRVRLDLSQSFSHSVAVRDVSTYGTEQGFRGLAEPGNSFVADGACEYSVTRNWVLAADLIYEHDANTRVVGWNLLTPNTGIIRRDSGSSQAVMVAPGVEYNFTSKLGLLVAVRVVAAGHNAKATITPAIALNFVH
jgi:hypothetical protein